MEWPKLKNIIIVMLACVNLFLLVLVCYRQWESGQIGRQARENAVAILRDTRGILLEEAVLPEEMSLLPMSVEQDQELERTQAAALLGGLYDTSQDAMRYEGAKGTAQFYADGEFSAEFSPGAYPLDGAAPGAFAVELLAEIGFEAEVVETDEANGLVTVRQLWNGAPVFDCTAVLSFQEGELREIRKNVSHRLTGTPQPVASGEVKDLVTMLLTFVDYANQNSPVFNRITGFTAGYALDTQAEPVQMIPTWYVTTDQVGLSYYWNAVTGEIRAVRREE